MKQPGWLRDNVGILERAGQMMLRFEIARANRLRLFGPVQARRPNTLDQPAFR